MQKLLDEFSKTTLGRSHTEAVARGVCIFCGEAPSFSTFNGVGLQEWELFEFTYHYCKEVLGDRSRTFFLTIRCRRDSMLPDIPKLNDEQWREIGFQYNPITFQGGRWYYWDETWSLSSRPFSSYEEALIDLGKYLGHLDRRSTRVE